MNHVTKRILLIITAINKKPKLWKRSSKWILGIFLVLLVASAVMIYMFVSWLSQGLRPPTHDEIRDRVERQIDINILQTWAIGYLKDPKTQSSMSFDNDISAFPSFVQSLKPTYIRVKRDGTPSDCVDIIWGGGLGHFGLTIGSTALRCKSSYSDDYSFEYQHWRDGVYTWIE